jgi:release factor glutamine methyltransferase
MSLENNNNNDNKLYKKNKFDPDISHLKTKDFDDVYEPSDDTYIFVDGLEKDFESIKSINPKICFEIG